MPLHKLSEGNRKKNLHLDQLLDENRLLETIDSDAFDYMMSAYRLKAPFEETLQKFRKEALKPQKLKDLWLLAYGAWATRTQVPFAAIANDIVDSAAEIFGERTRALTNAWCRYLDREGALTFTIYQKNPEKMLPLKLLNAVPELGTWAARMGRDLLEKPTKGIGAFNKDQAWDIIPYSTFLSERNQYQAMDYGSWLFCLWASEFIKNHSSSQAVTLLDACAAPGGKTMALHTLLNNVQITASDTKHTRIVKLKENLKAWNLHEKVSVKQVDWSQKPASDHELFDVVMADLPCAAFGTLVSQPDILHQDEFKVNPELLVLQKKILENVSLVIKKHGLLIVSLCSFSSAECKNIEAFLGPDATKFFSFDQSPRKMEGIQAWAKIMS